MNIIHIVCIQPKKFAEMKTWTVKHEDGISVSLIALSTAEVTAWLVLKPFLNINISECLFTLGANSPICYQWLFT